MCASNVNIIANNNFHSHKNDNNDLAILKTNIVFLHVFSLNVSPLAIRLYIRIVLDSQLKVYVIFAWGKIEGSRHSFTQKSSAQAANFTNAPSKGCYLA
jgi:hypothetical protein